MLDWTIVTLKFSFPPVNIKVNLRLRWGSGLVIMTTSLYENGYLSVNESACPCSLRQKTLFLRFVNVGLSVDSVCEIR
jgi:hypothetical protein